MTANTELLPCPFCNNPNFYDSGDTTSKQQEQIAELVAGVKRAKLFIHNGIALGFIQMPDSDAPDPAHDTEPLLDILIAKHAGEK